MADNVVITAGTGTTIHADEYTHTTLGSGKTQLVKLVDGTLNAEAAIAADIGVKANALRVAPASDITDATYIGDVKFGEAEPNSAAIAASLAIIDDWDDADYCNVNLNLAGTDVTAGAGAVAAGTPRITLASDDPAVALLGTIDTDTSTIAGDTTSIDGKITACDTGSVTISAALPAGANAIGKLAANSGVDIGDVDVTSCDGIAAEAAALGNGILIQGDDGTDRKNINVDATTGDVQVDVTNTVTVDCNSSNVTEVNSAAILADTANMDTNLATVAGDTTSIDSKITACNTGNVTIGAALPAGDNNIGNVDIASSVALDVSAATVTVDLGANNDVVVAGDVAHDSADSGNPAKIGFKAYAHDGSAPGTAVAEGDRANGISDLYGRQYVETIHPNYGTATDNQSTAQTNTALVGTPGAGLSIYVTDIIMSTDSAMNIKLVEDTGGTPADVKGPYYFAANGGMAISLKSPLKITANTDLGYTSSAAGNHTVEVGYFIAP